MPRTIRDIIQDQELVSADARTTVSAAARLMKDRRVGAIAVVRDGKLAGVFTERDALVRVVAEGRDPLTTPLSDVMTAKPVTIAPERSFAEALQLMHDGGFRHVPVVSDGAPVGMLSVRDAMGPELESFFYELLRRDRAADVLA